MNLLMRLACVPFASLLACMSLAGCSSATFTQVLRDVPPLDRSLVAGISPDDFDAGRFTAADGTVLPYRLLTPERIEPGRQYPLVVQFHNSGGIGADNRAQIEKDASARAWAMPSVRARHPSFVLIPQFSARSANYDDPKQPQMAYATAQLQASLELIDTIVAQHPVDPGRLYATGFSMGGSTTWLAAVARPRFFAAVVPVSAVAPDRRPAADLAHLPALAFHGDADTENPIASDREWAAALHLANGRQMRLREYVGLTHQPPGDFIPGDWWRDWMFAQHLQAH